MDRPRHGGNLVWAASVAGCPASSLTDFSASINPLGPPCSAIAAISNSLGELTAYPDPEYYQLRSLLAEHHQIEPDYILPGNGAAELLTWAGRELAQLQETYLITPAFGDYKRALAAFNSKITSCSLPLPVSPSPHLLSQSPPPKTGLLLNNPHNPTGKLWTRDEILPYLEQFALIVVDEAFMDFLLPTEEQSLIPFLKDFPNLVILRSLTKFYSLPGLRIGYAIAHPERLKRWQKWRDPWSVNTLAVAATTAAIQDKEFQQQTWNWLSPTRSQFFQGLSQIPGLQPLPGAANFLLVKSEMSVTKIQTELLKNHRLLIRDCLSFPELGDLYFRVAVRSAQDNTRLIEAIAAIVKNSN
ncbi:MAG: threonine-phosphate decarboxylase CobD [Pleurocapsa sp.]